MFKIIEFILDLISQLMGHLFLGLSIKDNPIRAPDMDNNSRTGDNNNNNVNNGCSGDSSPNTKSTDKGGQHCKSNINGNSNGNSNGNGSVPNGTVINNYYCYDQRVYNIYKIHESGHKYKGMDSLTLLNWKYILFVLILLILTTVSLCYLGADMSVWLIFHKVFGYLFNDHLVVVRSDVPV